MTDQTVLFTFPIHRLEPIFKDWVKEAIQESVNQNQIKAKTIHDIDQAEGRTILDTDQLMKKMNVTRPTIQRWRDQGRIPFIQVGQVIRYDLDKVIEALENKKRRSK